MKSTRPVLTAFPKIYAAGALLAAAFLSPVSFSFVPALLFVWYLVEWRQHYSALIDILTQYFAFFAVGVLYSPALGVWMGLAMSSPVLLALDTALEEASKTVTFTENKPGRSFTNIFLVSLVIVTSTIAVAAFAGSQALALSVAVIALYLTVIAAYSLLHFPSAPVRYKEAFVRSIAGKSERVQIQFESAGSSIGTLRFRSPYDWVRVQSEGLQLRNNKTSMEISFTPQLNGPATVTLEGYAVDRRGMIKNRFDIQPLSILVIPRARYAAWLASKYLAGTGAGTISTISSITGIKSLFGLRNGVEYYGSRIYQAGDSLKNIDWKNTVKFNELVSKEFIEPHGRPAVLLVNMTAGDSNEADTLAYDIVLAAISMAHEGIPASLAAYDDKTVLLTTGPLKGAELVVRSMQLVKLVRISGNPRRYLNPPDMGRLRASLNSLKNISGGPAAILAEILEAEYESMRSNAKTHACGMALEEVKNKTNERCTILSISGRNHDAEALEFNSFVLEKTGERIIEFRRTA